MPSLGGRLTWMGVHEVFLESPGSLAGWVARVQKDSASVHTMPVASESRKTM